MRASGAGGFRNSYSSSTTCAVSAQRKPRAELPSILARTLCQAPNARGAGLATEAKSGGLWASQPFSGYGLRVACEAAFRRMAQVT